MTKEEDWIRESVTFFVAWVICMVLWSIWLEGIFMPIIGIMTTLVFEFILHIFRFLEHGTYMG